MDPGRINIQHPMLSSPSTSSSMVESENMISCSQDVGEAHLRGMEQTNPGAYASDKSANHVASLGGGQSNSVRSEHTITSTEPAPVAEQPKYGTVGVCTPNIVIFGETGVGKSSVINLIAGREVARTSNGALGCTFQHERYTIKLCETPCDIWDTTGLDEGSEGRVPAAHAETNLRALIQGLARAGGIHLVIYCIRGSRFTMALKRSYDLFYVAVCRRKVPVALVVTGLEHQEGGMETWWDANEETLRRSGMRFDAHACVTTLDIEDEITRQRRFESRSRLHELVLEYSKRPPWKIERPFIFWVLATLRGALSAGRPGNTKTVRKVIICDMAADSQPPSQLCPGITAVWQRFDGLIGDNQYEFIRMDKRALQQPTSNASQHIGGVNAGVLVFYTSVLVDTGISPQDVDALRMFYDIAGGQTCPVVVVVRGCDDEETARLFWGDVALHHNGISARVTFLPSSADSQSGTQGKLNEVIEQLCIERIEVVPSGLPTTGKRLIAAFMEAVRSSPRTSLDWW